MVNKKIIICCCFLFPLILHAQAKVVQLSLEEAYIMLAKRYPALKDSALLVQLYSKEIEQIDKEQLPQIFWKADGRLQSENAQLDSPEGVTLPFEIDLPIYSIKTYLESQYVLLDGGLQDVQKELRSLQLDRDLQELEVEKYQLRPRVDQLFVTISILRAQEKAFEISLKDLQLRKELLASKVREGVVLESELTKVEVKELTLLSNQEGIQLQLKGAIQSLADLLGIQLSSEVALIYPDLGPSKTILPLQRPEQKLFDSQQAALLAQADLVDVMKKPQLGAFAQLGLGYPNPLNFLEATTSPYGLVGLQFNWKISNWKKDKIDKDIISLQALRVQNAKESFEFNMDMQRATYLAETERLEEQIAKEKEIARLQALLLKQLATQLEEGVITATDYLLQLNEELKARQAIIVYEMELQKLQLDYRTQRGAIH